MFNDDTRGIETPDRPAESHPIYTDGGTPSIRDRLTTIDEVTRALLVALYRPTGTAIEGVDEATRAQAASHVRQIRAEASHVGLTLLGPTATMHYSPFAEAGDGDLFDADDEAFTTTPVDPDPECDRSRDSTPADHPDQPTSDQGDDDDA